MRSLSAKCFGSVVIGLISTAIFVCPATSADNRFAVPDLSGQWGRDFLYFEQPPSGPGPVISMIRKADGTLGDPTGAQIGDYTSPILKREAAEAVKRHGGSSRGGHVPPDMHNMCFPEPPPVVLHSQFGVQILQQNDQVILLYLTNNTLRRIPLNVPHPQKVKPSWLGNSVGHYEGDTLVIDTVGIKTGPLSMLDWYGTPHSEALHVIERYRLIDGSAAAEAQRKHIGAYMGPGLDLSLLAYELISPFYGRAPINPDTGKKGLQVEIRVEDAGVFTTPWSALVTYRPVDGALPEAVCAENHHLWGSASAIPTADKPDF
jgi:hypothetical protein